jgi:DNA-binding GntR family transcriptional regulator
VFRRVANNLRSQLLQGAFPPDTALPTEATIADEHAVSRQTVRRAFQDLVAEGLVFRVPGRGTFATPSTGRYLRQFGSIEDLMALSADSELQVLEPLADVVDPAAAGRLRLGDDKVSLVCFLRLTEGVAFSHTRVHVPPSVRVALGDVPELSTAGMVSRVTVIGLLDGVLARPIRDAEQSISVAVAPPEVAAAMGTEPGTPVLRIDRTYLDTDSQPVELAVSHFHPDRYTYRVRLRRNVG